MSAFREAEEADAQEVVALWRACGLTRPWNDPYRDFSFALASENSAVLLHEADGRAAASVMVGHDGHRGMLYYVAVAPELQRRGLGQAAVRAGEAWLSARGVWKVNLLVRAENAAVKGFYGALGYEVNPVMCMARKIAE